MKLGWKPTKRKRCNKERGELWAGRVLHDRFRSGRGVHSRNQQCCQVCLTAKSSVVQAKRRVCLALSLTEEVTCAPKTLCSFKSSTSVRCYITHSWSWGRYSQWRQEAASVATNVPWYLQIQKDMGIPFLFTTPEQWLIFDLKLVDAGNLLILQLGRPLCRSRASWSHP